MHASLHYVFSSQSGASFFPKVMTPFHLGQSITLLCSPHPSKEEERFNRLDPKRALSFNLDRTKEFWVDNQLFLGYVGAKKGRAVQKRTISRWVVLCIKICYALAKKQPPEGLRAHSNRGKAATTALAWGVPVLDICQAATWASLHTLLSTTAWTVRSTGMGILPARSCRVF